MERWPEMVWKKVRMFLFPTDQDLADILGRTNLNFGNHILGFVWIPKIGISMLTVTSSCQDFQLRSSGGTSCWGCLLRLSMENNCWALHLSFSGKIGSWDMFRSAAGVMCWVSVDITCGEFLLISAVEIIWEINCWDYLWGSGLGIICWDRRVSVSVKIMCRDCLLRVSVGIKLWRLSGSISSWYEQLRFTSEINCGRYSFRSAVEIMFGDEVMRLSVELSCWYYLWNQLLRLSMRSSSSYYLLRSTLENICEDKARNLFVGVTCWDKNMLRSSVEIIWWDWPLISTAENSCQNHLLKLSDDTDCWDYPLRLAFDIICRGQLFRLG